MRALTVRHVTRYRYRRPVGFGPHRLMFRPRDSHDLRLVSTSLKITPNAAVRWLHDVFGNSIAIATFADTADELTFVSEVAVEHFGIDQPDFPPDFPVEEHARLYPFSYDREDVADLGRTMERHYPDPGHDVDRWARGFVGAGTGDTLAILAGMTRAIRESLRYERRFAVGVRPPAETLRLGSGSCRDLALLMMEAARCLGFAARFVSGYLYDPAVDGGPSGTAGAGETHAWVQVFLPGAGWVEYDPTNGVVGGSNLIRVAVARDPAQAVPLTGTWRGAPEDFIDMEVEVRVQRRAEPAFTQV
jgi:transglutaminase-like putative cysteine protease